MAYFNLTTELTKHLKEQKVPEKDIPTTIGAIYQKFSWIEETNYWVIGYGSLMNPRSAKKTLDPKTSVPATIKGWQRIFNLKSTKRKCTFLNVREQKGAETITLAHKVSYLDMFDLILRERNYDLVYLSPEEVTFNPRTQIETNALDNDLPVVMVVATDKTQIGAFEPLLSYVQAVINGANKISQDAVKNVTEQCVLADGQTSVGQWLKKVDLVSYFSKTDSNY